MFREHDCFAVVPTVAACRSIQTMPLFMDGVSGMLEMSLNGTVCRTVIFFFFFLQKKRGCIHAARVLLYSVVLVRPFAFPDSTGSFH